MCLILIRFFQTDYESHGQGLSRRFNDAAAGGSPLMYYGDHLSPPDILEGLQAVLVHHADNHSNGSSSTPGWQSEQGRDHVHIHGH